MSLIKCPECEEKNSDNAKFCMNCGFALKNNNNDINNVTKKNNKTIIIIVVIISIICILYFCKNIFKLNFNNITTNEIVDTNEIKAICLYDGYAFEKEDGTTRNYLIGNSQKTNVEVKEVRDNSKIMYNCDKLTNDIYKKYKVDASCDTDSKIASNGMFLYSYELKYKYEAKENINEYISNLKKQDYECIIYYNKENSVVNKNIIGTWCGYGRIVKVDEKFIFNEDGTGKHFIGNFSENDFYYAIDDKNVIHYSYASSFLDLAYNEGQDIIYDGMYLDGEKE